MKRSVNSAIKKLTKDKKIIISVLAIGLVIIFVFCLDSSGNNRINGQQGNVLGAFENTVMRLEHQSNATVISNTNIDYKALCATSSNISVGAVSSSAEVTQIKAPILMYHYVEDANTSSLPYLFINTYYFEAQLKTLKSHCYQTMFVRDVAEVLYDKKSLPVKNITLTFDDGYADWYYNVFPLLKKYQVKATMFVIVNNIGTPGYLTKEQMIEMANSGLIEFGSHTLSHQNLKKVTDNVAKDEISKSKKQLESILGRPVYSLAYPYGFFTKRDEILCQKAGYLSCVSTYPGDQQSFKSRYSLYRLRPYTRIDEDFINWLENEDHSKTIN